MLRKSDIMKKKYIVPLIIIGVVIISLISISTGYGVYLNVNNKSSKESTTLDCFKVYFSNNTNKINYTNVDTITNDEGKEISPDTITVTNICDTDKELQVKLNVLDNTTTSLEPLTLNVTGNVNLEDVLYLSLDNARTDNKKVIKSKLVSKNKIKPNETIRMNIKMWFDERKVKNGFDNQEFSAYYELVDTSDSTKVPFNETIIISKDDINRKGSPDFTYTSNTDDGLFMMNDGAGNSYYFRGNVNNNYVLFADLMWRIVRVNADNSIRLVLNNNAVVTNYSSHINAIDYTGLKYIYNDLVNNDVMNYLYTWYNENIVAKKLDQYVIPQNYCNDSSNEVRSYHTYFGGFNRLVNANNPQLACPATGADFGGNYVEKVGLLTADEITLAGGHYNIPNTSYYLANGESMFTMTPFEYGGYKASVFVMNSDGSLGSNLVTAVNGIRPVINLDSTVNVTGSGTIDDPYVIDK